MFFIYKILINLVFFFYTFIIIFRIFKVKEDKLRFKEKIGFFSEKRNKGNLIWFHGASVGEINSILPIVLCGGTGTRLWPLSRGSYPKQYLTISDEEPFSFLQKTKERKKHLP